MKFNVHVYHVVRTKVPNIEAETMAEAMKIADERYNDRQLQLETEGAEEVTGYVVDVVGDTDFSQTRSFDVTRQPVFSATEDQDDFPKEDWRYDVANGDTNLGYVDWVNHNRESANAEEPGS